jgi:HK97 family phage major capsid protein
MKKDQYRDRIAEREGRGSVDYSGDNLEALLRERALKVDQMRDEFEAAEARGFTQRDGEKIAAIDAEIDKLDERIRAAEKIRQGIPAPTHRDHDSIALRSDERIADRFEARVFHGVIGGGVEDFNLGRVVGALTGKTDRRSLSDAETRALAEGVDATGGFLVPELLSARLIDRARAKAATMRAGALTIPMGSDTLNIARLAGGSGANWKLENDPVVDSDMTFERVQLKAKTLIVQQKLSVELHEDLSPEGARLIENEIVNALALELDRAILRGSGTDPEPRGIRNQTGVNVLDMGTDGSEPTDFDFLIDAMAAVWAENGEPNAAIYSARTATTLAKLKATDNQPLRQPEAVADLTKFVSNVVPDDLDKGTSTDVASEAYVGDFSTVIVGVRPSLQIRFRLLDQRYMENLQVAMIAWLRADVALAHPEHMTVVDGILAA